MSISAKKGPEQNQEYNKGILDQNGLSIGGVFAREVRCRVELRESYFDELKNFTGKGVILYALKNKHQLSTVILADVLSRIDIQQPSYCHGVNMFLWQPVSKVLKSILNRFKSSGRGKNYLQKNTKEGRSSIIYFREAELRAGTVKDSLNSLMDKDFENHPVMIAPVLVTYGRRREKKQKSLMEIFLGGRENPGLFLRLMTYLRHSRKASVIFARPLRLDEFLHKAEGKSPETISFQLRKELVDRIDEEKRAIFGPVLKSREELMSLTIKDPYLVKYMEEMATREHKEVKALYKEADKYLKEIAADYNDFFIEIWDRLLTWLWNNIYDGVVVDKEGFARIRDISKDMPFVVIPCHRSHIDYLLLSYVFEKNNIPLPFIAAGTNLMFWPLGYMFRKSGAFFIRRSFKGEDLYGMVFAKYMKVLLKEGLPLEFFIEGGRSRTGKMVMPRYGLLSMVIQAYQEGISSDLAILPVFIGYDRVIEEKSYLRELVGEPKKKENAGTVLRNSSILRKRYGSVYVNAGEPILLKSYLSSIEKPFEDMTLDERRSLYRKIGYEIVAEINKVSVVTPFSMIAACLLCHYHRGISHNDLMMIFNVFYDFLHFQKVQFSSTFGNKDKAVADALFLFESSGLISKMGVEEEDKGEDVAEIIYSIEENKRLNLEYYKNNVLHFFIPLSFVATSILAHNDDSIALYRIMEDYKFLKRLFHNEFIFEEKRDDLDEVNAVLTYMHEQGMIKDLDLGGENCIEIRGRGRTRLRPFAGLIHNYIESNWVVIRGCSYLKKEPKVERDLLRKIQQLGTRMYKKGEVARAESLSTSNYTNALKFMVDSEILILSKTVDKKNREIKTYYLAESKGRIESLRQRVFRFL